MGAALGIDHGDKRTGFAFADAARILCKPLDVHHGPEASEALLDAVGVHVDELSIEVLVIGYPLQMDGSPGGRAQKVDGFIERLKQRFPSLPCVKQDERLTTKEAEDRLREAGFHGPERKARRDSWSAWILLEDWIRAGEPIPQE